RGGWGWGKERGPQVGRRGRTGALGAGHGDRGACPYPHRTLMRTPVVKRQTLPMSGFLAFFRSFNLGVVRLLQRLLTSFPSDDQTARVCTKHLLRLCHHSHGDSRELSSAFSAA